MATMLIPRPFRLYSLPLIFMELVAAEHRPFAGESLHPIETISIFAAIKSQRSKLLALHI